MMTLYVKSNCPFSARAIAGLDAFAVQYELKNIADEGVLDELMALGGKHQVPFLVDGDTMLYESQGIVDYIEKKCATEGNCAPVKPRIHFAKSDDICAS